MNTIQELEKEQVAKLSESKKIPNFGPGDTVRVNVKVVEGQRQRIQAFEGVCIARKNAGINSAFTVRKISFNEGVERVFPLYSPNLDSIEVVRRGDVRRAKLYYLRGRRGKSARIKENLGYSEALPEEEDVAPPQPKEGKEDSDARESEKADSGAAAKQEAARQDASKEETAEQQAPKQETGEEKGANEDKEEEKKAD